MTEKHWEGSYILSKSSEILQKGQKIANSILIAHHVLNVFCVWLVFAPVMQVGLHRVFLLHRRTDDSQTLFVYVSTFMTCLSSWRSESHVVSLCRLHECPQEPDFDITALIRASGLLLLNTSHWFGCYYVLSLLWRRSLRCSAVTLNPAVQIKALMSLFSTHYLYTPERECTTKERHCPTSPHRQTCTH